MGSDITRLRMLTRDLVTSAAFQARTDVLAPPPHVLEQPEKALQFGTGGFLRGFIEYFLDEGNRQGRFGGRVVMVGTTGSGRDDLIERQQGLYTLAARGIEADSPRTEQRVIGVVSRALSASAHWDAVLACARNPSLELVFSNTTETGIVLDESDAPDATPPRSFPGKLTRFLYERARAFDFDPARGVVVLPCELIEDNGAWLREIVLLLAERWELGGRFVTWIEDAVPFCNTLVDRIVPGTPDPHVLAGEWARLGYRDELLTNTELYRSFVIEGDDALGARLPFAGADPGIAIVPDVAPYRERKVRLLNGAHTASVAAALLSGCDTVGAAMQHELVGAFIRQVVLDEIVPSLDVPDADAFAHAVLERFANPFIRHALFDITLQCAAKLRVRVVPSISQYARRRERAPSGLALGFAAYILFMRGELQARRREAGLPVPADDGAPRMQAHWANSTDSDEGLVALTRAVCADTILWDTDLTQISGFAEMVFDYLTCACRHGVPAALEAYLAAHAQQGGER